MLGEFLDRFITPIIGAIVAAFVLLIRKVLVNEEAIKLLQQEAAGRERRRQEEADSVEKRRLEERDALRELSREIKADLKDMRQEIKELYKH
jgi:uncharacterized membrane protein (DUF106 family)